MSEEINETPRYSIGKIEDCIMHDPTDTWTDWNDQDDSSTVDRRLIKSMLGLAMERRYELESLIARRDILWRMPHRGDDYGGNGYDMLLKKNDLESAVCPYDGLIFMDPSDDKWDPEIPEKIRSLIEEVGRGKFVDHFFNSEFSSKDLLDFMSCASMQFNDMVIAKIFYDETDLRHTDDIFEIKGTYHIRSKSWAQGEEKPSDWQDDIENDINVGVMGRPGAIGSGFSLEGDFGGSESECYNYIIEKAILKIPYFNLNHGLGIDNYNDWRVKIGIRFPDHYDKHSRVWYMNPPVFGDVAEEYVSDAGSAYFSDNTLCIDITEFSNSISSSRRVEATESTEGGHVSAWYEGCDLFGAVKARCVLDPPQKLINVNFDWE